MQVHSQNLEITGTLRRGLSILNLLCQAYPDSLSVLEISRLTGFPRPTVYRLMDIILEENCITFDAASKKFRFKGLPSVEQQENHGLKNFNVIRNRMQEVAAETGNSVYLILRKGNDSYCLHREFGDYPIQVNSLAIGQSQPLGIGSGGLALLASFPDPEVEKILSNNADRLSKYNGISIPVIRHLIGTARARGYALIGNYAINGVTGIGMAIYSGDESVAAVCVSTTTERMSLGHQKTVANSMKRNLKEFMPKSMRAA